jgi:hypothetical protein
MKIPYNLLASQNAIHLRNYLYTFGYLVIENFFSQSEIELQNKIWDQSFMPLTKQNIDNTDTYLSVPNYIEKSKAPFFTIDKGHRFLELVKMLVGPNSVYCGSSAAQMSVPTPWHRDIFLKTPVFKFACYINNDDNQTISKEMGGDLAVVPGSQHASDVYSDSLSSAVHWPEKFGVCKDPVQFPMLQAPDGSNTLDNYPKVNAALRPFPYEQISVSSRDLLIFDQRIVHGSTLYDSGRARRMLVAVFALNPKQVINESKYVGKGYKREDAELELEKWLTNQLNASELKTLYDDLEKRDDLIELLHENTVEFRNLIRTKNVRVSMRQSLDRENIFNRRNMSDRKVPVCF